MAKKTETTPETTPETTGQTETPETEIPPMRYKLEIFGEKISETTGKPRKTNAGTVNSNGPTALAALDDLKAVLSKIEPAKLAKIVEIRVTPEITNASEPVIRL